MNDCGDRAGHARAAGLAGKEGGRQEKRAWLTRTNRENVSQGKLVAFQAYDRLETAVASLSCSSRGRALSIQSALNGQTKGREPTPRP